MNSSLPFLPPRDSHTLWYTPIHFLPSSLAQPSISSTTNNPGHAHSHSDRQKQPGERTGSQRPSALAQLVADEAEIRKRKANVARFGATWIRPPGVSKTYQALVDEAAERAEQDALAAREQAAAEQQAAWEAQEEEARRTAMARGRQEGAFGGGLVDGPPSEYDEADGLGGVDGERDLDDDVPDAEDDGFGLSGDEEDEVDLDATDDVDLIDDERNLDDDVPEAGSYQHTDTDVEDSSTDADFSSPVRGQQQQQTASPNPVGQGPTVIQDFSQPSLDAMPIPRFQSSPAQAESSMLASSSPGLPRARIHGQTRRPRNNRHATPDWNARQPDFNDYGQP